ncbi:MAG: sigma-70 family RNA polymerase sigma factor [Clostridia bacterium]|nr:sigma-70 family RNA polymerase sigma factor [Clostridia bacterium]
MSKIYFVMNNRNDISKGYKEVTEEFVKNYIASFPKEERAYFINLGYAIMETDEESYRSFYSDYERQKYLNKLDIKNGLLSYDALDSGENQGAEIVADNSEPFEEKVLRNLMIDKLPEAFSVLSDNEKKLIEQIYFEHFSERELAEVYGVSNIAIHKRKKRILQKLKNFFEN